MFLEISKKKEKIFMIGNMKFMGNSEVKYLEFWS